MPTSAVVLLEPTRNMGFLRCLSVDSQDQGANGCSYELIPERTEAVTKDIKWSLAGVGNCSAITNLNCDGVAPWLRSQKQLNRNNEARAAKDVHPTVVAKDDWLFLQAGRSAKAKRKVCPQARKPANAAMPKPRQRRRYWAHLARAADQMKPSWPTSLGRHSVPAMLISALLVRPSASLRIEVA